MFHPPRVPLIQAPTPLHRLDIASERLGIDLWIKRDDLTGFALGGNKGRKLEFLLGQALEENAQTIVTCGALHSNFIRQLGAAAARFGIHVSAAVMELPYEDSPNPGPRLNPAAGSPQTLPWLGVEVTICPDSTWENLYRAADDLADAARQKGKHVMQIPVGGSSPLGVEGMRRGALEVPDTPGFHQIVFASSSGSTHAGLLTRFRSTPTRVIGIACDPEAEIGADFAELANGRARLFGEPDDFRAEEFHLDFGYVGTGYGTPSQEGIAAIRWLARTEGIFLDPIYSARAFAAVIDYARQGRLPGRTLFWHTGGVPNLFALPNEVGDTELRNLGR